MPETNGNRSLDELLERNGITVGDLAAKNGITEEELRTMAQNPIVFSQIQSLFEGPTQEPEVNNRPASQPMEYGQRYSGMGNGRFGREKNAARLAFLAPVDHWRTVFEYAKNPDKSTKIFGTAGALTDAVISLGIPVTSVPVFLGGVVWAGVRRDSDVWEFFEELEDPNIARGRGLAGWAIAIGVMNMMPK